MNKTKKAILSYIKENDGTADTLRIAYHVRDEHGTDSKKTLSTLKTLEKNGKIRKVQLGMDEVYILVEV